VNALSRGGDKFQGNLWRETPPKLRLAIYGFLKVPGRGPLMRVLRKVGRIGRSMMHTLAEDLSDFSGSPILASLDPSGLPRAR